MNCQGAIKRIGKRGVDQMDFAKIAKEYDGKAVVQASAGQRLLALLDIKEGEDVLDLGCGTGTLTMKIREKTSGRVMGIDAEVEMIEEARKRYGSSGIFFNSIPAEEMTFQEEFDVIFCNSVFQWFRNPEQNIDKCYKAMRKGGRIGVQAPAREVYSPNFIEAIERVRQDTETGEIFKHFREPWFFLETEEEYRELFERTGFQVILCEIEEVVTEHTPEEVFRIFDSGASAGYLNQRYYDVSIDRDYIERFRWIVKETFQRQAGEDGKVSLIFNRLYVVAKKERNK